MAIFYVLFGFAAVLAYAMLSSRATSWAVKLLAAVVCVGLAAAALWVPAGPWAGRPATADLERPVAVPARHQNPNAAIQTRFVGSQACQSCHPGEYESWYASYHRTMTQVATPRSVVGKFDGRYVRTGAAPVQLLQDGDTFLARQQSISTGQYETRKVVMTTGSHHLQMYWLASDKPRVLDKLPYAYWIAQQSWVPVDATFLHPPRSVSSAQSGQWNTNCLNCHATGSNPGFPRDNQRNVSWDRVQALETNVVDFGIACEACHGPGGDHCDWFRNPIHRYQHHWRTAGGSGTAASAADTRIIQPQKLDATRATHVCSQCHGVFFPRTDANFQAALKYGFTFRPGEHFEDSPTSDREFANPLQPGPALQQELRDDPNYVSSMFWNDGVVRVTGREFNGLSLSPCYHPASDERPAITCLSCHQMHQAIDDPRSLREWADDQLKPAARGNQACLQCHAEYTTQTALQQHTHHAPSSSGSECYNCHMPHTTFGLLGAIRSHAVETPSVAASLATGRPNGCNLCHLDQTLRWTADALHAWYGREPESMSAEHETTSASALWAIRGDAGQRALIAWAMGWAATRRSPADEWRIPYLLNLMEDEYDAVRGVAFRALQSLRPELTANAQFDYAGLLPERTRAVREIRERTARLPQAAMWDGRARVLITDQGEWDRQLYVELLRQRDNRPVLLNE